MNLICHTAEPAQANTPTDHPVSWIQDDRRHTCGKIISSSAVAAPVRLAVEL
ncbi:hypothetical protein [Brevundimonas sp.]|uniref:hypothetical protein n=1 Tax=Brevundimonas sp. TaxID=1871086 RepID=UPI00391D7E6F